MPENTPLPQPALPEKNLMISDLSSGNEVEDTFILAVAQQGQSRNGPYWRLEFRDASGSINGKIWSPQSLAYTELPTGKPVWLKGRVGSYRDRLEIVVDSLRMLTDQEYAALELSLFLPASPCSPECMLAELEQLVRETLTHKPWRKLISDLLADAHINAALRIAPAAKAMHHAYAGGLLEHTLSVARLCLRLADHYPQLDRQTLFAGAICHDLGKIWELSSGLTTDYTQAGRLIGHIFLFLEHLAPFLRNSGLEPELAEHLQHLILSHHGSHEFGSPRLPATAEALALHYADNMDAKLHQMETALAGVEGNGWSAFVPSLERFLFRASRTPEASPSEARASARPRRAVTPPEYGDVRQSLPLFDLCSSPLKE